MDEVMLRWLVIGLLVYGLGTALREGWLDVQWRRLLHDAGLSFIGPDQPLKLDSDSSAQFGALRVGLPLRRSVSKQWASPLRKLGCTMV